MTGQEWIARFAEALGMPEPRAEQVEAILQLAGAAAHASERTAAPVACWLAATAGLSADEALVRAERLSRDT